MRWVIFGNGPMNDYTLARQSLREGDFIVCCDGGTKHTYAMQITPHLILGDFDSSDSSTTAHYKDAGVPFAVFPVEKDFTDMELAMQHALDAHADEILILAGTGGRLDHTLANMHVLLQALERGISATLIDEQNTIRAMQNEITLHAPVGTLVSLVPADSIVTGVTTENLYYPLRQETLCAGETRGISNVMTDTYAVVRAESGRLFVIQSTD